jgi:squalene synthase HpnC
VVIASTAAPAPDVVERAYGACVRLARDHYENFPVASMLVPKRMRRAVAAVYAFARRADDFADEPGYTDEERLRLLDDWHQRLMRAAAGSTRSVASDDLIFVAVADAMHVHQLPVTLFADLLSAFRQDVTVKRYQTWSDVLDYCSRSANPVGRLVLRIAGHKDEALDRASDALCTALQLTNFWQDFARDWGSGRLYVPITDRDASGAREADLDRALAAIHASPAVATIVPMPAAWKTVLRELAQRTRRLFAEGHPVCDGVHGRLKYELRLTWLGGMRILDRLERADFEVFANRPTLTARDIAPLVWRTAFWTSRGR